MHKSVRRVRLARPETPSSWLPSTSTFLELFSAERSLICFINKKAGVPIDPKTARSASNGPVTVTTAKRLIRAVITTMVSMEQARKILFMPLKKRRKQFEAVRLRSPAAGWISSLHGWAIATDNALPLTREFIESRIELDLDYRRALSALKPLEVSERGEAVADVMIDTLCTAYPYGKEYFREVRPQLVEMCVLMKGKTVPLDEEIEWKIKLDFYFNLLARYEADTAIEFLQILPNDADLASDIFVRSPISEILDELLQWQLDSKQVKWEYKAQKPFHLMVERWAYRLGEEQDGSPLSIAEMAQYMPEPDPAKTRRMDKTVSGESESTNDELSSSFDSQKRLLRTWRNKPGKRPSHAQLEKFVGNLVGSECWLQRTWVEYGLITLALEDILEPLVKKPCLDEGEFLKRRRILSSYADYWSTVYKEHVEEVVATHRVRMATH